MQFTVALSALAAFLAIASAYAFAAIGNARNERIYTSVCLALLIAIAGLCGYQAIAQIERDLTISARV